MSEKTKKPFKMPHTFVIIFTIILAAVALTWIIPEMCIRDRRYGAGLPGLGVQV